MKWIAVFILGFVVHHFTGAIGMLVAIGIGLAYWWMSSKTKETL